MGINPDHAQEATNWRVVNKSFSEGGLKEWHLDTADKTPASLATSRSRKGRLASIRSALSESHAMRGRVFEKRKENIVQSAGNVEETFQKKSTL